MMPKAARKLTPHIPHPSIVSTSLPLPPAAVNIIAKSDILFIASKNGSTDGDCNHRGGSPGFARLTQDANGTILTYPEYSGNRFYQTLGNLTTSPVAGITFPDFDTGDILYLTGTVEILIGEAASKALPRTHLAVRLTVTEARFLCDALGVRTAP